MLLNQHERQVVSEAKIVCGRFHVFDESVTALAKAIGHCFGKSHRSLWYRNPSSVR
jgi:hypothetical protein